MIGFLVRRAGHGLLVLLAVSVVVFALSHATGDPAAFMLPPSATTAQIEQYRVTMGFDRSIVVQYLSFLKGVLTLDFGNSYMYHQNALGMVFSRLGYTAVLAAAAVVITILIAVPLGTLAAVYRGSLFDKISQLLALLGQSAPTFLIGVVLMLIFTVNLKWLPAFGSLTPQGLLMPALTLGLYSTAETMRIVRSSMLDVLHEDFIRTVRAKGAGEGVVLRHAIKNSAVPIVTMVTLQLGALIGGAVVTELVFSYPGVGMLAVQAIQNRDFILVQAFVLVMALIVVVLNILGDLFHTVVDPRIRLAGRSR